MWDTAIELEVEKEDTCTEQLSKIHEAMNSLLCLISCQVWASGKPFVTAQHFVTVAFALSTLHAAHEVSEAATKT